MLKKLFVNRISQHLKDKSGVVIIVDHLKDYNVVNGVEYFFDLFLF